jgi:Tfp pilus assembly protein PilV
MKEEGFSFVEVLISLLLLLGTLLMLGAINMTSVRLIGNGKINQRATLLLLDKIEELRAVPIESLDAGEFEEQAGYFVISWRIQNNSPYFGTKQIQCRISYKPAASVIAESIFYRSE